MLRGGTLKAMLLASVAMASHAAALAQEANVAADDLGEEIVVTGSRLTSRDNVSSSPITTTTAEELALQGTVNIEDALVELPQAVPGTSSSNNNGSNGTTTVNLRGLGDVRTLVLVDGKRWIPSGNTGVVDLNTIPTALIKRVEVVTGGASAVYGSDALAGVVNFILDDSFEGVRVDTSYNITERGDGGTFDANLTVGGDFGDDRGNATAWVGYTDRKAVFQGDRDFSAIALGANRTDDGLIPSGSTTAFPTNILLSAVSNRFIDTDGDSTVSFGPNGELVGTATNFNTNPVNYLLVPQKRVLAGANFTYDLGGAEVFGRLTFANNRVSTQLAPSGTFFASFFVNPDNPFLPPATVAALAREAGPAGTNALGQYRVAIGYRFAAPRKSDFSRNAYQALTGVRGDIGDRWKWEAFGQYSRTEQQTALFGDGDARTVQQALLARNVNGTIQCIDPSNGCVPLNLFTSDPTKVSPAAIDFISLDLQVQATTEQSILGGTLAGDLGDSFKSPFAESPIGLALGVEYRDEDSAFRPDANYAAGRSLGFTSAPIVIGGLNVKEIYGEVRVPIIEDKPFFHALSFEGGYRVSDYSTAAGTIQTFKVGGDWAPIESLRFRGLYQRAVRAPNINELFQPVVEGATTGNDPCAGPTPAGSRALCEATGVPAGRYGAVPLPPAGQFQSFQGGNPDLDVEKSNTYTIGAVFQPSFAPRLSITADYYSVKITDAIAPLAGGAQNALNACYLTTKDINSVFCQQIVRDPVNGALFGGNEAGIFATQVNTGRISTKGVDVTANYSFDLGQWGGLRASVVATYVDSFVRQGGVGLPAFECAGRFGSVCGQITPDFKTTTRLTWDIEPVLLSLRWRHLDSVDLDRIALGTDSNGRAPVEKLGARDYFDFDFAVDVREGIKLSGGIANLLDKDPPIFGSDVGGNGASANTYPGTYDGLGRSFRIGAQLTF